MLLVPALASGCRRRVLCTPPQADGSIPAGIRYIAAVCGVTTLARVGGAQAIAAMAYGTDSIPRVDKIFGPGNSYVTIAKQCLAADGIAIDLPAGPSEVLVIADDSAPADFVISELLAQAEHGPDGHVLLVTDDEALAEHVRDGIDHAHRGQPDDSRLTAGLQRAAAVVVEELDQALAFANAFAPEHLVLLVRDAAALAARVTAAGSVFVGPFSPVAAGDYATGTNHTLPTSGAAAAWSGLGIESFQKTIAFQEVSRNGLETLAPTIEALATAEGLSEHARSVRVRLSATAEERS
jgi:histidinol dehydrogenase